MIGETFYIYEMYINSEIIYFNFSLTLKMWKNIKNKGKWNEVY